MPRQEGQYLIEDFFANAGGLNTADSPFLVSNSQATGGKNYDYLRKGGFQKRAGHSKLNSSADAQLKTLGLTLWDKPGANREFIRAAGTKIQRFDVDTSGFTNLTEDTAGAGSDFLSSGSEVPVVGSMFNTPTSGVLWQAGGGMTKIHGVYSSTKVTANGVADTSGTTSTSVGAGAGTFASTGTYRYAFALYKAATGAIGNAGTECSATVANVTDEVTITLSSLGAVDTTKYTKLYVYRSAVSGAVGFTTGALIKQLDISAGVPATTVDTGSSIASAQNVPRAGNTLLDNSPLPSGTYKTIALFKRRLVTASGSTVYISDLNKSESWPLANQITVPSGGDITGLGVISYNSAFSGGTDEFLCIFKQRELWVVTGSDISDWELKFVDNSGCPNQSLVVPANGFLAWLSYRGVFMWNGSGKPIYCSQSIEDKFQKSGDIDKSKLPQGFGVFAQSRNEIQWYISSTAEGTQKYVLKLDLRLTLESTEGTLGERKLKGVFTPDVTGVPVYAGLSAIPSPEATDEVFYLGDNAGFLYTAYVGTAEAGSEYTFQYDTPYLTFGSPGVTKRIQKVILWVLDTGAFEITLRYWSNYRYQNSEASSQALRVSANLEGEGLVWDVGRWDINYWDTSSLRVKPLTFNVSGVQNNTEGDSFRFRFEQTGSAQQVVIYGFSVMYTESGVRK